MISLPKNKKASRHQGIKALRRRGFSLIEVLMAIFILGIGMISIAALFPAGIAQQRQSADDIIGASVANNALAIIRRKVQPEDFGTFEEFGLTSPRVTLEGDWPWRRPGFYLASGTLPSGTNVFQGDISIFVPVGTNGIQGTNTEIPYNSVKYDMGPPDPEKIIRQRERYYPQASVNATNSLPPRPVYVWDCMFRRFQGKVLVAIFVYRATRPGGGGTSYVVAPNNADPTVPPLPIWLDLTNSPNYSPDGVWDNWGLDSISTTFYDNHMVYGTVDGVQWNMNDDGQAWQSPRQWILDQNNSVHRVLSSFQFDPPNDNQVIVELVKPISPAPNVNPWANAQGAFYKSPYYMWDVVSDIWYIPLTNSEGLSLTPIYLTVKEL